MRIHSPGPLTWAVAFASLSGAVAYGADGDLDPTFGVAGKAVVAYGDAYVNVADLAVQPDGMLLAAGTTTSGSDHDMVLARFTADGAFDASFGLGGAVTVTVSDADLGRHVLLQSDGRIVVVGVTEDMSGRRQLLARFLLDGTLDPSFGSGGLVVGTGGAYEPHGAALQADDRIVTAGSVDVGGSSALVVTRYEADGALDATFGSGGIVVDDVSAEDDVAYAVVVRADGHVLVAGESDGNPLVVRYDAGGSLDGSFGAGGVATIPMSSLVLAVVSLPDGRIVAAGTTSITFQTKDLHVFRLTDAGALDATFGSGDVVTIPFSSGVSVASGLDLVVQPDGRIVTHGTKPSFGAAIRLEPDGTVDATFSACVVAATSFGSHSDFESLAALVRLPDGRLVVGGYAHDGEYTRFALARLGTGTPTPACDGTTTGASKVSYSTKPVLTWKWKGAGPVTMAAFGEPDEGTDHVLCLLDDSGAVRVPLSVIVAPGTSACLTGCPKGWKEKTTGFTYSASTALKYRLVAPPAAVGKIVVRAKQHEYRQPLVPTPMPLVVRAKRGDGGACWESRFSTPRVNVAGRLVAVSD